MRLALFQILNAVCAYPVLQLYNVFHAIFQVIRGGNFDVDLRLFSPSGKIMYDEQRKQYDSISFHVEEAGEHYFCFSNEFSSFTHKTIYFDLISDLGESCPSLDLCVGCVLQLYGRIYETTPSKCSCRISSKLQQNMRINAWLSCT